MNRCPILLSAGTVLLDALAQVGSDWLGKNVSGCKGGCIAVDAETSALILQKLKAAYPVSLVAGGSAANTVSALGAWGVHARLFAMIGKDAEGAYCLNSLKEYGVELVSVKVHPVLPTGRCISMVTPDSERTMRTFLGASDKTRPEELSMADFAGADFLLFEGYLLYNYPLTLRIFELAEANKIPVGFDLSSFELVGRYRDKMPYLLRRCTALFANREEAAALFGEEDDESLLAHLNALAPVAVLKLGRDGALIRMNGCTCRVAAEPVAAVDTTGAGDLWQAGFLYGYLRGRSPELCGRFAAATAAELVQVLGARLPLETLERLKQKFTLWENEK